MPLFNGVRSIVKWWTARCALVEPSPPISYTNLFAKNAEQRYQSAAGLRADLEICAREWARRGKITAFPLGLRDVSEQFNIPKTLYGREREVAQLNDTSARVCCGASVLLLVAGYAGVGKTSLIQAGLMVRDPDCHTMRLLGK